MESSSTRAWVSAALIALTACASGTTTGEDPATSAAGHSASGHAGASGASASAGGQGGAVQAGAGGSGGGLGIGAGGGGGSGPVGTSLLYAHTGTELFQLDPMTLSPTDIGTFDCIHSGGDTSMTDIAVSASGELWGVSKTAVHRLAVMPGGVVHCVKDIPLQNAKGVVFYALTFAPAGILDPSAEVLVAGNTAGELWSVDGTTGALSLLGDFGAAPANDGHGHDYSYKLWQISGDIVFLSNGGNPLGFATLRDCDSASSSAKCDTTDTLVQVDMNALKNKTGAPLALFVRGKIVQATQGCTTPPATYGKMFGIAALGDKVYGFSATGTIAEISNVDGSACAVSTSGTMTWDGAGVTTAAVVIAPPDIHLRERALVTEEPFFSR